MSVTPAACYRAPFESLQTNDQRNVSQTPAGEIKKKYWRALREKYAVIYPHLYPRITGIKKCTYARTQRVEIKKAK